LNWLIHAPLGGMARNFCELYNTAGIIPQIREGMSIKQQA
jgi:galactonate dehydratase